MQLKRNSIGFAISANINLARLAYTFLFEQGYLKVSKDSSKPFAFDHAIRLNPNYANVYYGKGVMLQRLNRNSEAQAAFAKAKQLGFSG